MVCILYGWLELAKSPGHGAGPRAGGVGTRTADAYPAKGINGCPFCFSFGVRVDRFANWPNQH